MSRIFYITDPEILAMPIRECGEPLVDVKHYKQLAYGPAPECELTTNDYTKMRKSVWDKLCHAQTALPSNWRFRLYEGFRSIAVQQMLFDHEHQRVKSRYPEYSPVEQFHETTRLVSPVTNFDGSLNIPAHNTGGAVDIEILTEDGQLLDMGMTAKDWCHVAPELCLTECKSISQSVQKNRQLLLEIMQAYGFVNYPTEWWHFSYGDRYWAYHKQVAHAIYNSADKLPVELFAHGSNPREQVFNKLN